MSKITIETKFGWMVSFERTPEKEKQVFDKILQYCVKNNCFTGKILQQDDDCLIEAPDVLSDIIDNIIFFF